MTKNVKVMLAVFFDFRGVVHRRYVLQVTTITKEYYQEVLRRIPNAVRRKHSNLWAATKTEYIHHYNAPAYSSYVPQIFLVKHNLASVHQVYYSSETALSDLPQIENAAERHLIWINRIHYADRYGLAEYHFDRWVPEVFPTVVRPLEEVCALPTKLLGRTLMSMYFVWINVTLPTKGSALFE